VSAFQVALEYRRLGIEDSAQKWLARSLARDSRFAAAHEETARVWRDWGLPEYAVGHAYRAVYFAPASASAQNTLGTVLDALGRLTEARAAYEKAAALDPGAAWALNNLCYLDFRLGRLDEARRQCQAAIRLSPGLSAAHNNLGLAFAATGDLGKAGEAFFAAGDEAAAHYNLGVIHLAQGRYAAAAEAFEKAIEVRPAFTAAKQRAHNARMRSLTTGR
jgi:tetratricopeptide (TPR) repeat protein